MEMAQFPSPPTPPGPGFVSNNFGLGLFGTSSDNLVEQNKIGGNLNGLLLGGAAEWSAACYILHVSATTAPSHRDCGAACLPRGVPLAIATDDGTLYFPADGNERLKGLLNARVRASGTVVEKHDPMELKVPVGDKNQMAVRVEGGYKQITIQTLEKISPAKRRAS